MLVRAKQAIRYDSRQVLEDDKRPRAPYVTEAKTLTNKLWNTYSIMKNNFFSPAMMSNDVAMAKCHSHYLLEMPSISEKVVQRVL